MNIVNRGREKVLIILRGLPGSGKTTLAHQIADVVCCADDFFYKGGEYQFDPKKLAQAHQQCRDNVKVAMEKGVTKIAVANTATQVWEFEPYLKMAQDFGYQCHSLIVENRHGSLNCHDVPDTIVESMRQRFEIQL